MSESGRVYEITSYDQAVQIIRSNKNIKDWILIGDPGTGKTTRFTKNCIDNNLTVFCSMVTKLSINAVMNFFMGNTHNSVDDSLKDSVGSMVDSVKNYSNSFLNRVSREMGNSSGHFESEEDTKLTFSINAHTEKILRMLFHYMRDRKAKNLKFVDILMIDEFHLEKVDQYMIYMYWLNLSKYSSVTKLPIMVRASATYSGAGNIIKFVKIQNPVHSVSSIPENAVRLVKYMSDYRDLSKLKIKNENQAIANAHICIWKLIQIVTANAENQRITPHGTGLIFLPGYSAIKEVDRNLKQLFIEEDFERFEIVIAHSMMKEKNIDSILSGRSPGIDWKIILCTDILETSLTVSNVNMVVSSMYCRREFEGDDGTSVLRTCKISKQSAEQQAGRTGRDGISGIVLRMCKNFEDYENFDESNPREIFRLPIEKEVLKIISIGEDLSCFFPQVELMALKLSRVKENLRKLGCIDIDEYSENITECGKFCTILPISIHSSLIIYKGYLRYLERVKSGKKMYNLFPDIILAVAIDFYQDLLQNATANSYPLSSILSPYIQFYRFTNHKRIVPKRSNIKEFCTYKEISYDIFRDSLKRINEICNTVGRLISCKIMPGDFLPSLCLKRLLVYAHEIFPVITKKRNSYVTDTGKKYEIVKRYWSFSETNLREDEKTEQERFIVLSSYKLANSSEKDPLKTNIFIPDTFREMDDDEEESLVCEGLEQIEEETEQVTESFEDYSKYQVITTLDDFFS